MSNVAPLFSTGVPGLDTVLGGGLSSGSMVFLTGISGAGKTILSSQILYNTARSGVPVLILTAFSESHVKLIEHLSPFSFFDPELVGSSVILLSMQSLVGDSREPATTGIIRAIRESGARLVLIDGFQGLASLLPGREAIRQMVASLAGQLPYLNVTLLFTLEGSARDPAQLIELATADIVIGLEYRVEGWRHVRRLEIVKQRGRGPLAGLHSYSITSEGIGVFPRLETALMIHKDAPVASTNPRAPATFGLPELDRLLHGGLTHRTSTLLAASPGVGKTLLGLHWALAAFASGAACGKSIYLTFHEYTDQLRQKASAFGLPLDQALEQDAIRLIRLLPIELSPDYVAAQLIEAMSVGGVDRLVIDDLAPLLAELGPRARDFLAALKEILYRSEVTNLLLFELPPFQGLRLNLDSVPISLIADNVIMVQHLHAAGALHRILAVLKMRYSFFDHTVREIVLEQHGIRVLTPAESAPGILTEIASTFGGAAPVESSPYQDG